MLETAVASLRFGASMTLGVRFNLRSLERLVGAMLETTREFGGIGSEGAELLAGPGLDDDTRREMQLRRFRSQALRAMRTTSYYGNLFAQAGLDPAELSHEGIATIPLTPKEALRGDPDAFVNRTVRPSLRATTTGTTGWPTSVQFSRYEMRALVALASIAVILRRQVEADDLVQIGISSRAILGVTGVMGACANIGAAVYLAGLLDPEHTLALLTERRSIPGKRERVSVMSTYPSYLGEIVETGLRLGYGPKDFGLRRLLVGGELLTQGLRARCQRLFGPVELVSNYGMTELAPFGGNVCSQEHLHFDPSGGLVEVLDLETRRPAGHGQAGSIVATPFFPYRETTLLLRYDTEDVIRTVAGPLTCEMRNLPATSNILGKRRLSVRHDGGWTFLRDVVEALEGVEAVPLPARFGLWATSDGVGVEVLARSDAPEVGDAIHSRLEQEGVPVRELRVVTDRAALRQPIPLRGDLRDGSLAHAGGRGGSNGSSPPRPHAAVLASGGAS